MPQYPRILIHYRLPHSDQWSDLQWCDLQKTATGAIQVRVAPTNPTAMPDNTQFRALDPQLAAKLLVVDCSNASQKERASNGPLIARASEEKITYYCLICIETDIFRFDFNRYGLFNEKGMAWIDAKNFDSARTLNARGLFQEESKSDPRLLMRTREPVDYPILQADYQNISLLQQQYQQWETESAIIHQQQEKQANEEMLAQEEKLQSEAAWKRMKREPVSFVSDGIAADLNAVDRLLLHDSVCQGLARIKANSQNSVEYQTALWGLLNPKLMPILEDLELSSAVRNFREMYLCHSIDLRKIFTQEVSTHPSLYSVCDYVNEAIFLELQHWDPSLAQQSSQSHKMIYPESYRSIYLGQNNDMGVDVEDDAAYALRLQMQEYFSHSEHSVSVVPNQAFVQPGAVENQYVSQARPEPPRLNFHSLFAARSPRVRGAPSPANYSNFLLLMSGLALCAFACYLLTLSPYVGLAVMLAGICCLLIAKYPTNRPPESPAQRAAHFWGY